MRLRGRRRYGVSAAGRQMSWVTAGIEAAGRKRSDIDLSFVATTSVSDDEKGALDAVRSWASVQARLLADVEELPASLAGHREELVRAKDDYDFTEHLSTRAEHREALSDDLVRMLAIAGPAEVCVPRLSSLLEAGIDNLILHSSAPAVWTSSASSRMRLLPLV